MPHQIEKSTTLTWLPSSAVKVRRDGQLLASTRSGVRKRSGSSSSPSGERADANEHA